MSAQAAQGGAGKACRGGVLEAPPAGRSLHARTCAALTLQRSQPSWLLKVGQVLHGREAQEGRGGR